jgi:cation transport protein ChaC
VGLNGRSRDYIAETLAQLEDLGIHDGQLSALLRVVDREERVAGVLGE